MFAFFRSSTETPTEAKKYGDFFEDKLRTLQGEIDAQKAHIKEDPGDNLSKRKRELKLAQADKDGLQSVFDKVKKEWVHLIKEAARGGDAERILDVRLHKASKRILLSEILTKHAFIVKLVYTDYIIEFDGLTLDEAGQGPTSWRTLLPNVRKLHPGQRDFEFRY
jgi:hypothetical protein